jgi:peptide/nickel transport system ATP-binding protein/oligopeptide transport system ATP-binding protein
MSGAPLLSVRDLAIRIGAGTPVAGVSLDVFPGEMLGIVGESGSGKSLTLRAILRLLPNSASVSGRIGWDGQDLLMLPDGTLRKIRGRDIAIIFQEPMTALNPILPIGLQITECLATHLDLRGAAARRRAIELLDQVGIPDARRRVDGFPHEFSGGMRQRAMIAIALSAGPRLLLADEPTTALDVTIQDQILKLMLRLKDELGLSIVLVTHDLAVVAGICDRVAVMYAGRVMESGAADRLFQQPAHAYTLGLLGSLPDMRHVRQKLTGIPGQPPDPAAPPPGCRFAPRCRFAEPACEVADPPLAEIAPAHQTACLRAADVQREATAMPA